MPPRKGKNAKPTASPRPSHAMPLWLGWLALLIACAIAYYPALHGGLLWDDTGHVTKPELQSSFGLARIWFELGAAQQYYPVLHTAFWLEHRVWGDSPLAYHILNVVLHATSAALVVLLLRRLAIRGAWFAGFVFALHPVCVESVAWISEQKNTLSTVFYLLAVLVYHRFNTLRADAGTTPGTPPGIRPRHLYALATVLYVLAVLTKSVTATLPAALLVITWWQTGKLSWRRDVLPLLPWFAFGIAAGLGTAWVEHHYIGAHGATYALDFWHRCMLAGRVAWFYFAKLLWPADLIFVYPRWNVESWGIAYSAAGMGLLAVLGGLWALRRKNRGPLAGALFFVGSLFPALGFFNVFPFVYSYVADHFQYLASLGVIVPACAGIAWLVSRAPGWARAGLPMAIVVVLGFLTRQQSEEYRDNISLYRSTLARNPHAWMASYNLGMELAAKGQLDDAIASYHEALDERPDYAEVHANLAIALLAQTGHLGEVISHLETAIRLSPDLWQARLNLGNVLASVRGREFDAIRLYREVIAQHPLEAEPRVNLALVLLRTPTGRREATRQLETALRLKPDLPKVRELLEHVRE